MGVSIDGFTDVQPLGSGGLGDVYVAIRSSTGSRVAIKVLRDSADSTTARSRTRREVQALLPLRGHPNVIQIEEFIELNGVAHIVMELAPGGSIADAASGSGGRLPFADVVLVGEHTASALVAAHSVGVLHLDIKPPNLLVGAFGTVKLCDFGIASVAQSEEFRERTVAMSVRYASPEQLEERDVGSPADIYMLGATLGHLATGITPPRQFDGGADQWAARWPVDLPNHAPGAAAALLDLINRCMQAAPHLRPTAEQCRERLDQIGAALGSDRRRTFGVGDDRTVTRAAGVSNTAPSVSPPAVQQVAAPTSRPARRRMVVAVALAAAVVMGGSAVAVLAMRLSDDPAGAAVPAGSSVVTGSVALDSAASTASSSSLVDATLAPQQSPVTTAPLAAPPAVPPVAVAASASVVRSDSTDACGSPTTYQPGNAIDGRQETAWMVPGDGVGASITIELAGVSSISRVGLMPGYNKFDPCTSTDRFYELRRVTAVRWTFDDGSVIEQSLEPVPQAQFVEVGGRVSRRVTMTIVSSLPPGLDRLDFAPVSEVVIE